MKSIKAFLANEEGLETVEYAMMTALVVAALISAFTLLSTAIMGNFQYVEGLIR
jgi:Flp pilus assembly pilin Flp